jgi:tRNA uridine 5-carboxymethylaminomethyl modification enzyme
VAGGGYNLRSMQRDFDVIVIGGGHAGAEAAWAAANMLRPLYDDSGGSRGHVALITMDPTRVGTMSCNPAIGGLAKGQMVREIDALGGLMGLAADATGIQFKVLNRSKGPAVRGPRCQSDKYAYAREVQRLLATRPNLDTLAGTVDDFIVEAGRCVGVVVSNPGDAPAPRRLVCGAVVLTTGTFMRALMHTGEHKTHGGRVGEGAAVGVSAALRRLGFELGRLKTGTPPRLRAETIDFACLDVQPGDAVPTPFSDMTARRGFPAMPQVDCWVTHTSPAIHERIMANLDRAPMYNGQIETQGPRYCPSIEDKVVRFADRPSHHVFLEPESLETEEVYCNGISTSLPADVQDEIVRGLPGCERAEVLRYGYAVEYDMVWPHQIDATGMTKLVPGLLLAGQINGTSGYEEAAGQGLIAGVNAVLWARDGERFQGLRLRRDQAYIGVLMDDLVTKTPREPYRMFTSRAEHRLLLRADNTDERLTPLGRDLGLVDDARWDAFQRRRRAMHELREAMASARVDGVPILQWARRPEVDGRAVVELLDAGGCDTGDARLADRVVADLQYAGYVERMKRDIERLAEQEAQPLPIDPTWDYQSIRGLRTEAALTLNRFRPATLGQAGRLAGVNPADLMVVSLAVGRQRAVAAG